MLALTATHINVDALTRLYKSDDASVANIAGLHILVSGNRGGHLGVLGRL